MTGKHWTLDTGADWRMLIRLNLESSAGEIYLFTWVVLNLVSLVCFPRHKGNKKKKSFWRRFFFFFLCMKTAQPNQSTVTFVIVVGRSSCSCEFFFKKDINTNGQLRLAGSNWLFSALFVMVAQTVCQDILCISCAGKMIRNHPVWFCAEEQFVAKRRYVTDWPLKGCKVTIAENKIYIILDQLERAERVECEQILPLL